MLSGLVLAGGRSSRMGRDKAGLRLPDGRMLLQRQIDLLRAAGIGPINVSAPAGKYPPIEGVGCVSDEVNEAGPLAGIAAGLRAAPAGLVLVLAVDMPSVEQQHLCELVEAARKGSGVVPLCDGRMEPLVAVYPTDLANSAASWLAGGQSAVHAWVRHEVALGRVRLWETPPEWTGLLRSWNAPEDLPQP